MYVWMTVCMAVLIVYLKNHMSELLPIFSDFAYVSSVAWSCCCHSSCAWCFETLLQKAIYMISNSGIFVSFWATSRLFTCFNRLWMRFSRTVVYCWFDSPVAKASDWWLSGRKFEPRPPRCRVTTLDKLFTPMCLSPSSIIWYWPMSCDALRLGR